MLATKIKSQTFNKLQLLAKVFSSMARNRMSFPLFTADAFTTGENTAFSGNPAGVCFLEFDDDISDTEKQKIASEMNLGVTAFVSEGWTRKNAKLAPSLKANVEKRTLRWFTPQLEIPLCGHASMASSKCLFTTLKQKYLDEIEFESKFSGILGAKLNVDTGLITLNFPANPPEKLTVNNESWSENILRITLGSEIVPLDVQYSNSTKLLLIRLKDELGETGLLKVSPNFQRLLELDTGNMVQGIIVTVKGEGKENPDFYSRFFAPWIGINEDPATGSSHTVLASYWDRELNKNGETLLAKQSSARGGEVHCALQGKRVQLSGQVRIIVKGELLYQ